MVVLRAHAGVQLPKRPLAGNISVCSLNVFKKCTDDRRMILYIGFWLLFTNWRSLLVVDKGYLIRFRTPWCDEGKKGEFCSCGITWLSALEIRLHLSV